MMAGLHYSARVSENPFICRSGNIINVPSHFICAEDRQKNSGVF